MLTCSGGALAVVERDRYTIQKRTMPLSNNLFADRWSQK
jgi:hypothetical protein